MSGFRGLRKIRIQTHLFLLLADTFLMQKNVQLTAAAAAAKLHQSCPTLRDPIDGSTSGSAIPGILQGCHFLLQCNKLPVIKPEKKIKDSKGPLGLPWVSQMIKNPPANAGDPGLIPGWGRSPGEGNDNPLQYSCLENSMYRGAWRARVHGSHRIRHDYASNTFTKGLHVDYFYRCLLN